MRIIYAAWLDPATTDLPLFLAEAWKSEGHEVYLFPYDLEFSNRAGCRLRDSIAREHAPLRYAIMEERIEAACRRFRADVLLFGYPFVTPEAMQRLRKKHGCLISYFVGHNNLLDGYTVAAMRIADFLIVHDSYLIPLVRGTRYGRVPHVLFLPGFAYPLEHHPVDLSKQDVKDYGPEVAFIGGSGHNRVGALRRLTQYDLRIWGGREWRDIPELAQCFRDEPVYGLKKTKIYNAARIVLNIDDDEKQVYALNPRVPEVLACGGFVLTEWRKDLERTGLVDGESVAVYRSPDELAEKVAHFLSRPEERRRISFNGRRVVLETLTHRHIGAPLGQQIEAIVRSRKGPQA